MKNINDKLGNNIGNVKRILNQELVTNINVSLNVSVNEYFANTVNLLDSQLNMVINNQLKQEKFPDEEHNI